MSIEDYPHPALTVDIVLLSITEDGIRILLVERDKPPFEGTWSLPGGFINVGESPEDAARRELEEETGIKVIALEQLHVFGDPGRDPRGHVVTLAYLAVLPADTTRRAQAGSDAAEARWWSIVAPPLLAFDHADILAYALEHLRSKLACGSTVFEILSERMTLGDLRAVCRALAEEL